MKTLSYVCGSIEEITVGEKYCFGQIWDGEGDGCEILASGTVSPDGENIVSFTVLEEADNVLDYVVVITDIY